MTSTGQEAENHEPATEYPGYCAAHAAAAAQYEWPFAPFRFPGCASGYAKPDDFDVKTQPHLAATEKD